MLSFSSGPLSKSCPALRGANPLAITAYFYDPEAMTAPIRLGIAYDAVSPAPGTRYTMWQLSFDMTNAVTGPGTPGVSCGGADTQLHITCTEATLSTMRGESAPFHTAPGDVDFVTWNVGPPVPAVAATWGRLKGLYR
jgi:hypothetical protein